MTKTMSFAALGTRRVQFLYSLVSVFVVALAAFAWAMPTHAATVTAATGTITDPDGNGVESVSVELHNGDGSVRVTGTTDSSGNYSLSADDSAMDGEQMTLELTAPDGYNEPSNSPYQFTYSIGDAAVDVDFQLVLAPKEVTVSVVDENGDGVERFDVYAVPLSGSGTGLNSQITGSSGSLDLTGGEWAISIDRNLSETDASRYPWVAIGGSQTVTFADDNTSESTTLSFEVIGDATARLVTAKLVNKDGDILVGGSFNGDVTFNGFTRYGAVSTRAKVDGTSGVASLYLLPGIYKIDGYHSTKLVNQSYDPRAKYVITAGSTTQDLGTITASENTGSITGVASLLGGSTKSASSKRKLTNASNINLTATNVDSGRSTTDTTDSEGNFQLINLGPGNYSITTSDSNYITKQSAAVEVGAGESVTGVEMTVAQADVTVSGTVQNNGAAVVDARAVVVAKAGGETFSAPVDPDTGAYSMKVYDTGDDTLNLNLVTQVGSEVYADTTTVDIGGQTSVTQNIGVSTDEGTISGSITDFAEGGTVTSALGDNAEVIAIDQSTGSVEKAEIGSDGSYSLNVAPGNWKVLVDINDEGASAIAGVASDQNVKVSAGSTNSGVTVPVHVGDDATVSGTLKDPSGNAVEEARVFITNQKQLEKRADKKAKRKVNPEAIVSVVTETDGSGNFSQSLPDGKYTAFFSDNPGDSGDVEPLAKTFTVTNGTTSLGDIAYRDGGTTVSGKVDKNLEDAQVVFTAKKGSTVTAEVSNGTYSADLPAGTYSATVSGVKGNYVAYDEKQVKVKSKDKSLNFKKVQKTDVEVPAAAQASCDLGDSCVVSNTAGAQVRLAPYAASLSENVTVSLVPKVNIENAAGFDQVGVQYEVDIRDSSGFAITQLEQPADITLPIDKDLYDDKVGKDELTPSFKQEDLDMFLTEGVQAIAGKNSMTIKTEHLTPFAVTTADTGVAKPKKARKLKAVKRKAKKATLRWKSPKNTSNIARYRVQVRELKVAKKKTWKKLNKKKKLTNKYVKRKAKNLTPGTQYQFRVKAINTAGKSKWTKWKRFKTKAAK